MTQTAFGSPIPALNNTDDSAIEPPIRTEPATTWRQKKNQKNNTKLLAGPRSNEDGA